MMRSMRFSNLISVSGLALLSAMASAQFLDVSSNGSGTLRRGGESTPLRGGRVVLNDDRGQTGYVEITGSKVWRFIGRWREAGRNEYRMEIENAYDDVNARGSITILLERGELEEIRVDGTAKGTRFTADFRGRVATGGGGTTGGGWVDLNLSRRGTGRLEVGRDRSDVRDVRLTLDRRGKFFLSMPGVRFGEVRGVYRERRTGQLELELREGLGFRDEIDGSGTAVLNSRRELQSVNFTGRGNRESFSFRFDGETSNTTTNFTLNANRPGEGTYVIGRREFDARQMNVDLRRDGTFRIDVVGRNRETLTGTYRLAGDRAELTIDRAFGSQARGTGTISLTRNRRSFTRINFDGRVGEDGFRSDFRVRENDDRPGRDPDRPIVDTGLSFTARMQGLPGQFDDGLSRNDIVGASVDVKRDGTFSISLSIGETTQIFGGTYTRSGDRLNLRITRGFGSDITGTGTLQLGDNGVGARSFNFEGNWKDRRFRANYGR